MKLKKGDFVIIYDINMSPIGRGQLKEIHFGMIGLEKVFLKQSLVDIEKEAKVK